VVSDDSIVDDVCELYCREVLAKGDVLGLLREAIYYYENGVVGHLCHRVS